MVSVNTTLGIIMLLTAFYFYLFFNFLLGGGRGVVFDFLAAAETGQGHSQPGQPAGHADQDGADVREEQQRDRSRDGRAHVSRAHGTAAGHGGHNPVQQLQEPVGHMEPEGERADHREQLRR